MFILSSNYSEIHKSNNICYVFRWYKYPRDLCNNKKNFHSIRKRRKSIFTSWIFHFWSDTFRMHKPMVRNTWFRPNYQYFWWHIVTLIWRICETESQESRSIFKYSVSFSQLTNRIWLEELRMCAHAPSSGTPGLAFSTSVSS